MTRLEEGKGLVVAHTPVGEFVVQRSIDGVRNAPLGTLWRPLYFDGGWAIHGNPHVPAYPASHGCVRTADIDQDFVFSVIDIGDEVWVITVDRDTAIQRTMERDGVDREAVESRLDSQLSNEEREAKADRTITNESDVSALINKLDTAWSESVG